MHKLFLKVGIIYLITFFLPIQSVDAQLVLNEICPSNISVLQNSNGEYSDWIEIYNSGSTAIDLTGYGLSDEINVPKKFEFENTIIYPGQHILVFASDSSSNVLINHYEMAIDASSSWKYTIGSSSLDTNWRNNLFNDNTWSIGQGGFGFGDNDDGTIISNSISVMMRKSFTADTSEIINAFFMMDYDDGFVAYLNGIEIARANIGNRGTKPQWDELAKIPHEASLYQGLSPDSFYINPQTLKSALRQGQNILAVEVHDAFTVPTDMSSNSYLIFGMKNSGQIYSPTPSWFVTIPNSHFNAKFKLSKTGETIYLTNSIGSIVDQITYPEVDNDHTYCRIPDGGSTWCFTDSVTPASSNNSSLCYSGYASNPIFSLPSGSYTNQQTISIFSTTPGAIVKYTTNGNDPTASSRVSTLPFSLLQTESVRARVFEQGKLPGKVITNTYFIGQEFHLPAFSISTDSMNLWDYNSGIFVYGPNAESNYPYFGANFWQDWQKPAAVEYFDKDKNRVFFSNAEMEVYGNYSRYLPQKSLEIKLSSKFGSSEIAYPLIPDKSFITKYDRLILRNSGTDCNFVHFRDALMQRLMKNTYSGYVAAEPVVLFLNGNFWGVYMLKEKTNQNWVENNFGFKKDEINFIEEEGPFVSTLIGSDESFQELYNYATTSSPVSAEYIEEVDELLDLRSYADYFIAETYYNNGDWLGEWTNNIKIWQPKIAGGKWKYILIDTDFGFGLHGQVNDNRIRLARFPIEPNQTSDIFRSVLENPKFRNYFINRYADLINTIYQPGNVETVMKQFKDSIAFDMIPHFNKWGGDTIQWNSNIDAMMSFVNQRPGIMRNILVDEFDLNSKVTLTINTFPTGSGRIEISTIIPSTYPWSGVYFNGNPVTITAIPNPGFTFDHWASSIIPTNTTDKSVTYNFISDDFITAYFTGSQANPKISISEINYHSSESLEANDWIELHNFGSFDVDVSEWTLKDEEDHHQFKFPTGTVIPAGGYIVASENLVEFKEVYPEISNVVGPLEFSLSNNGESIRLFDHRDSLITFVNYSDQLPWPIEADGNGYTCELINDTLDESDGNNWFKGCFGGSPGRAYSHDLLTPNYILGDSILCNGDNVILQATNIAAYNYQWLKNNSTLSGENNLGLTILDEGIYSVDVEVDGCSSISDPFQITEMQRSRIESVQSNSSCMSGAITLSATSPDVITWYDKIFGNPIATGSTFTTPILDQTKTYYVQSGTYCKSEPIQVIATIEEGPCDDNLTLFPNPSSHGLIKLQSNLLSAGFAMVEVTDLSGQLIMNYNATISPKGISEELGFSELGAGLYLVTIYQAEIVLSAKLVILH